jgi:hypothetical protein
MSEPKRFRLPADLKSTPDPRSLIRDVWAENLHEEMAMIREIVEDFPYVSMVSLYLSVIAISDYFFCLGCYQ